MYDGFLKLTMLLKKKGKKEDGQVIPMVLILMLIGALIIAPLMGFIGTGIKAGQSNEQMMKRLYAADAGVEHALWKIMNSEIPVPAEPYNIAVNDMDVEVVIPVGHNTAIDFFRQVGALDSHGAGDYNRASPHGGGEDNWMVVYNPVFSAPGVYDSYEITITYQGAAANKRIYDIGCWIYRLASDDGGPAVIEDESGIVDDYPIYERSSGNYLGTYVMWEWTAANRPVFIPGETKTLTFTFSPPITVSEGGRFPPNVSWVRSTMDIFISWQGATGFYEIISTATDPATDKSTTIESVVFGEEPISGELPDLTILTWTISP